MTNSVKYKFIAVFTKGVWETKTVLQKPFLSLKTPTRFAAGKAHYFLLEGENLLFSPSLNSISRDLLKNHKKYSFINVEKLTCVMIFLSSRYPIFPLVFILLTLKFQNSNKLPTVICWKSSLAAARVRNPSYLSTIKISNYGL